MKINSIKRHLRPYIISKARASTITNAFVAAIADYDIYDEQTIRDAIRSLGQNPDGELICIYCDDKAKTWDHLFSLVKERAYSGYGHQIGNLVPCCSSCNSNKGGKNWEEWLRTKNFSDTEKKITTIRNYHDRFFKRRSELNPLAKEYLGLLDEILRLMAQADDLAEKMRNHA